MRTANIFINQPALTHNLNRVNSLAPQSKVIAMVKANAYGHGIDMCLPALEQADAIGVATLAEAIEAQQAGWHKTVCLIEGVFSQAEWQTAMVHGLQCVIHHQQQVDWALTKVPDKSLETRTVWLKYNTGMNRLGFSTQDIIKVAKQLNQAGYQLILTSHFANADDNTIALNAQQGMTFSRMLKKLKQEVNPNIQGSLCNSAGIINFPEWHYDWVRPGIMLYGSSPVIDKTAQQLNLQSVMCLSAQIMAIHQLQIGEMVGYGSRWIADTPANIAVISIGYGDGYPRVIDDTAWVGVQLTNGTIEKAPIIGRVAMDMIMVDLTHLSNYLKNDTVGIDSPVILWGSPNFNNIDKPNNPNNLETTNTQRTPHIDEIAKSAATISYELLCRMTNRPNRCS